MSDLPSQRILRVADNTSADVEIVELTQDLAREKIDQVWWSEPGLSEDACLAGDAHWKWRALVHQHENKVLAACMAVLSSENYLEGAIAYEFNAESRIEDGKGSLYIGWLASAPRNRSNLVRVPMYKGVGSLLLHHAIQESYSAGLGGRILLNSLTTADTLRFYRNKGFEQVGPMDEVTGLIPFEMPESVAMECLKRKGDLS